MDMAVYMHIQRGRIGYLKTWGHINEQLLYNSCLNFFSFMSYFLYYHGQAETYNNYLYIYIFTKLYTNFIVFLFSCEIN